MSKHTPTPWELNEVRTQCGRAFRIGSGEMLSAGKGCCIIYDDYPGNPDNERAANAAFIVRAVNSHEALVRALKGLVDCHAKFTGEPGHDAAVWAEADDAARAALKSAES